MKEFTKTMLAVIAAFIIWGIIRFFFLMMMFASAVASGASNNTPLIIPKNGGVLDMDFSTFTIGEQSQDGPSFTSGMSPFGSAKTIGLRDAVLAIREASSDPSVKYILLRADEVSAGMAQMEEIRKALEEFRGNGKAVVAVTSAPGNGSYYLSSVADKILMGSQHGETYQLLGLATQQIFLRDLLAKLGVNVQLIRHGKYKSAGEMFIRNSSSKDNREQLQAMITSLWNAMSGPIAESRNITVDDFNALLDNLSLVLPEDFLDNGLVDELVDRESANERLRTLAQLDSLEEVHYIPFTDYAKAKTQAGVKVKVKDEVAVIYADGEIVTGSETSDVAGDRFAGIIDGIRKDDKVKAAVLRVNSPGGSVVASIKIREALDRLQSEKPLVASYGEYAASGGYWISCGCQKIYADATTITGSIGVFSMIPEFSGVTSKLGVNIETIGSNKHSDMLALMRPFDAAELKYLQASVEDIYEMFVDLVATSRGMEKAKVDEIAQGRVWAANDALSVGLVDEIGTLEDAISYAAALADLPSSDLYNVKAYPAKPSFVEELLEELGVSSPSKSILSGTPFEGMEEAVTAIRDGKAGAVYARLPYSLEIR